MDENEWGYHGEGNKSLVVAHAQVSDRRAARLRASPTALAALCLLPSSSGRDSSSSFRSGGSLVPPSQYPQLRAPPGTPVSVGPLSSQCPFSSLCPPGILSHPPWVPRGLTLCSLRWDAHLTAGPRWARGRDGVRAWAAPTKVPRVLSRSAWSSASDHGAAVGNGCYRRFASRS